MSDEFESGFMVRTPSWHKKENAVLANSPATWEEARIEGRLTWEVQTEPVYAMSSAENGDVVATQIEGWQSITRDDRSEMDTHRVLAIQKSSYAVIKNAQFGEVINAVLGLEENDDPVVFEVLMSLYGGRQVVALIKFIKPISMQWDSSLTYRYLCLASRHDGQGGLRGMATNVRVVCANTLSLAEMTDGTRTGFTIKHTSNWEERVKEVANQMIIARGESAKWLKFAEQLALYKATNARRETYLKRLMPVSDDMTEQKTTNVLEAREDIRMILKSPTCEHIAQTGYGLLMAATEWNDHHRDYQSTDTYVSRQLLHKEPLKAHAAKVLLQMAKA